eukprot:1866029-Pyramimonas_sp.AAC.1
MVRTQAAGLAPAALHGGNAGGSHGRSETLGFSHNALVPAQFQVRPDLRGCDRSAVPVRDVDLEGQRCLS